MNEMNTSPQNHDPRQEMEARITALLLNELPPQEAAQVREAIAKDPALAQLCQRLQHTIGLVRETVASPTEEVGAPATPLKLSSQRREQLLQQFKTLRPREFAKPRWNQVRSTTLVGAAAALVIIGFVAMMLLPVVQSTKTSSQLALMEGKPLQTHPSEAPAAPARARAIHDASGVALADKDGDALKTRVASANGTKTDQIAASPSPQTYFYAGLPGTNALADGFTVDAGTTLATESLTTQGAYGETPGTPAPANGRWQFNAGLRGFFPESQDGAQVATGSVAPSVTSLDAPVPSKGAVSKIILPQPTTTEDPQNNDLTLAFKPAAINGATKGLPAEVPPTPIPATPLTTSGEVVMSPTVVPPAPALAPPPAAEPATEAKAKSEAGFGGTKPAAAVADVAYGYGLRSVTRQTQPGERSVATAPALKQELARGGLTDEAALSRGDRAGKVAANNQTSAGLPTGGRIAQLQTTVDGLNTRRAHGDKVSHEEEAKLYAELDRETEGKIKENLVRRETNARMKLGEIEGAWAAPQKPGSVASIPPASNRAVALKKEYADAKREWEEQKHFGDLLQMKYLSETLSERSEASIPRSAMPDLVDRAVPATEPASPIRRFFGSNKGYESVARVRATRDESDIGALRNTNSKASYDPYFIQTEAEIIKSTHILDSVIENLNLRQKLSRGNGSKSLGQDEARDALKKQLQISVKGDSDLLEIKVKNDDPFLAAAIANEVASSYLQMRQQQRKSLSKMSFAKLEAATEMQQQKVKAAQEKMDSLATQYNELDLAPHKPAAPAPIPQPEVLVRENAFSTFSLNISDVSFKLAAASLERGVMPEPGNIRSEEFINAFDYRDPEPAAGAPMTFAWERARYPFAQNRDILRFSLKTAAQGRQAGKPLNLVLVLDKSGSMERADRVQIIREALRVLATQLHVQDKFSVITFARTARLVADGVSGDQAARIGEEVAGVTPDGGTNLEEAMRLAYSTARRHYLAGGINRVVLLTDGAANLGSVDPNALKQQVDSNRKQGIALDGFGVGWEGYNDDLLETLTRNGDGRYGFINTPQEAATRFAGQLAGALRVAASDVKVQVEFNPARVNAYRQIGYAKHQLTKEQFRDNTVDAAEIGAAESGNALYVIEINAAGSGPLGAVRVRYKVPGTTDYREQEWTVPYQGNAAALDQANPSLRLAATASAFSEWLAGSPFAAEVTPDRLLGYLRGVPEIYGADARPKKLEWMLRQAKSISK
jgi:Mg-chelatase subunit ChlD/capsular polysaccharide biosynthesis protein/anti-sigma factor RsiW